MNAILMTKPGFCRRDMFSTESKCQKSLESTSQSLRTLVGMVLGGLNIQTQTNNSFEIQAVFNVDQHIFYNSTFRHRKQQEHTTTP